MDDASFIIEGKEALVTLEEPLFKDNVAEFSNYVNKLNKPVEKRIADYHLGGTESNPIVMPEGMSEFTSQGQYAAMMNGFAKNFGEAIVNLPTGTKEEVKFGSTPYYAGISFAFHKGLATDFPAASLLIGGKVWYAHWAPVKAHLGSVANQWG